MIYPALSSLLKQADSRYTLAILIAKRARMLTNGAPKHTDFNSNNDVTLAIHEISEGKITYHRLQKQTHSKENLVEASLNNDEYL